MKSSPSIEPEYDFIVCGAGTSGCVVAGRLAENPNVSVLVIEAGQRHENLEDVHMPGGFCNLLGKDTDWNITSEKSPAVNDRQIKLSRGKFVGGSSGCNGTVCVRGSKQDYDDWGLDGWSGDEFFEYMKKAETFHDKPWFKASAKDHGYDGPLHIEPQEIAPISEKVLESMISNGLPLEHDMFTHGETPHGCGHALRSHHQGLRSTAADFITKDRNFENLKIMSNTLVDRILLDSIYTVNDCGFRATGVKVVHANGQTSHIRARKEVILSSGSLCSPVILNRSGIGAPGELDTYGIPTLIDLPAVGKNLMDHLVVFMFYETGEGLTHDHLVHHGGAFYTSHQIWKDSKSGFLSSYPSGIFAFARLDDRLADSDVWNSSPRAPGRDPMGLTQRQPNVEFWNTQAYGGPHFVDNPASDQHAFGMVAELFGPQSRGTVTLGGPDPFDKPVVDCAYLTNPLDVEVLAEGCRFTNEIITKGASTRDIIKGSWPPGLTHHQHDSREDWAAYVKEHATSCFHYSGTCAMGKARDSKSVVDEKLVVRGVKNLRVADCSIIPTLHGGHTQMPAYGIGEKCADMVKLAWAL